MLAVLAAHPWVATGLVRGWQLNPFINRLKAVQFQKDFGFIVGDFTAATDSIDHNAARICMHAFLDGYFHRFEGQAYRNQLPYLRHCVDLLASSRYFTEGWMSTAGILMGDPGSKAILTVMTMMCLRSTIPIELNNVEPHQLGSVKYLQPYQLARIPY